MLLSRRTRFITGLLGGLTAACLLLMPLTVSALPYDEGNYGGCAYGQNCAAPDAGGGTGNPTSSNSSTGGGGDTDTPADPTGQDILLNDFQEYAAENGKTLDLEVKQVIYFNVQTADGLEKHSVTVQEIGADYVVLVIASEPQTVRLNIGQTGQYDVTDDGQNDIAITLNSIANQKANLTFRQLTATPATTASTTPPETAAAASPSNRWTLWASLAALILGVCWLLWLAARRRNRKPQAF